MNKTKRALIAWCAGCFRELRKGELLYTIGQDDEGNQVLVCYRCVHDYTCPLRLSIPA